MASIPSVAGPATEPIPVLDRRPGWRESFGVLGVHNFRLYVIAELFDNIGIWMARIAIGWLMLELTGDVTLVGVAFGLQFAPAVLLGAWAGILSDRLPRRYVVMASQFTIAIGYGVLAALTLAGVVRIWHVILIASLTGVLSAMGGPSRSAFISEMVTRDRLRGAITINAMTFHVAGLMGPALSGALVATVGSGWSIAVTAVSMGVAVVLLALMRSGELTRGPRQPRAAGQFREAIAYSLRKPTILWSIVLAAFVSLLGMNTPVLLAAAAGGSTDSGAGATEYGLFNSMCAVGALLGAVLATRMRTLRLRDIVVFAGLFGVFIALAGGSGWYPLFLSMLVGVGIARMLFVTSAESLTQLSTNPGIRGRVMSIYIMVMMGGQATGNVLIGWIAQTVGASGAFLIAGGAQALAVGVIAIMIARRHQLRLSFDLRSPRRAVRIVSRGALGPV